MTALLVFSGTCGYRHPSIDAGVAAVGELAAASGFDVIATEDATCFNDETLAAVDCVVWMQTSGTGNLDVAQRAAYERFTQRGGGFAGVHAASDAERDWPLFTQLVGARFLAHPGRRQLQEAALRIELTDDPSVTAVPQPWVVTDEWYAFDRNPRGEVEVIASLDESGYDPEDASMGADHPIVWRTQVGPARAWYTALGHEEKAFADTAFRSHLWGGIRSVLPTAVVSAHPSTLEEEM